MVTARKRLTAFCFTLFLLCVYALAGCGGTPKNPSSTTAAPFPEGDRKGYEALEETRIVAQKEFDAFADQLFQKEISGNQLDLHFLVKNPQSFGISAAKQLYNTPTLETMKEDVQEWKSLLDQLNGFDENLLTEDQKLTSRILKSYLTTELKSEGLELYTQPLAPTIGIQAQLPILLSEYTFYQKQDVEDYLALLAGIDDYYQQLLLLEQEKAAAGLMMSDSTLDHVVESCESYLLVPGNNFMLDTFRSRLDRLEGLSLEERASYEQRNAAVLESDFVPAYNLLIEGLKALKGTAVNQAGLCGFPEGKAYYEYLVYSNTGTSYKSVEQMLEAMENRLDQDLREVTSLTRQYPELLEQVSTAEFRQKAPDEMIAELKTLTQEDFPQLPQCNYVLKEVPKALELSLSPAFYLTPPIDDYQSNVIYINNHERFASDSIYPTLAHEGYPGHLYQNVYFRASGAHPLRQILPHTGFAEGWATYVERYIYTLDNGLNPQIGQLLASNTSASLGLQACLDVYINYHGWNVEQVKEYLDNFYEDSGDLAQVIFDAMVENPTNYLSYYVGFLEIQNMMELAQQQLENRFQLKEFHTFLLDLGPAPFDVVQPYFTAWLLKQKL